MQKSQAFNLLKLCFLIGLLISASTTIAKATIDMIIDAAEQHLAEGNAETAEGLLRAGIGRYPDNPLGYETLARLYVNPKSELFDYEKAAYLNRYAATELNSDQAKFQLIDLLMKIGEHKEAYSIFARITDKKVALYNYYNALFMIDGLVVTKNIANAKILLESTVNQQHKPSIEVLNLVNKLVESQREIEKESVTKHISICNTTGTNSALNQYCLTKKCDSFSNNHSLWTLCERGSSNGYADNFAVWDYLENGRTGSFSGNKLQGAMSCAHTFETRKEFVIYSESGFLKLCD